MNLENKTNSIWREMGVLACAGIMTFNTACNKHGENAPKNTTISAQKQNLLQPVNFDVLDQYGRIFAEYRDVTYAQSKKLIVDIPADGKIVLRNIQSIDGFVEDIMIYYNGSVVGGHAFKKKFDFKGRGFKAGDKLEASDQLEKGKEFAGAIRYKIRMVPSPEPEPQPEPCTKPGRPKRSVPREYEPVEEQPQAPPVIVYYPEQPRVVRFVGGPRFIFQSGAGYVPYGVRGYAPYPMIGPVPSMGGVGCVPYGPRVNNHSSQAHSGSGIQRRVINRSSLAAPGASRGRPVTRSNLSRRR